jgi:hypothetical protein
MMCAGTPIGYSSDNYMTEEANKKADDNISELAQIVELARSPHASLLNTHQTLYYMMRLTAVPQFTFMERVTKPLVTAYAAERIDIALFNAITAVTDITPLLPQEGSDKMDLLHDQMFMPISLGGNGFMSAEDTADGAFVAGALLQSASLLNIMCPDIAVDAAEGKYTKSIYEGIQIIAELKATDSKAVQDVDLSTIWTKSTTSMQRKINQEKLQTKQSQYMRSIPAATQKRGVADNPDVLSRKVQMLTNEDSVSNAWMLANPGFPANHMSNINFSQAFAIRCGLNIMGSRSHCVCGEETDCFGYHGGVCRLGYVKTTPRHYLHSALQHGTWKYLKDNLGQGDYGVENGEPHIINYFNPRRATSADIRSDICINNKVTNVDTIVDVTSVAPSSKSFRDDMKTRNEVYKPGRGSEHGERKKDAHYNKHFFLDQRAEDSNEA